MDWTEPLLRWLGLIGGLDARVNLVLAGLAVAGVPSPRVVDEPWPRRATVAATRDDSFGGFARDGRAFVVVGSTGDRWFDLATGRPLLTSERSPYGRQIAHAPDGRSEAEVSFNGDGVIWRDAATQAVRRRFSTPGFQPCHVAFAADGRTIHAVLAALDRGRPAIRAAATWDLATGRETRTPIATQLDWIVDYSPDGRFAAHVDLDWRAVQIHDLRTDRPVGSPIAVGGDSVPMFGMVHIPPPIRFAPDGQTLLVGQPDGRVECWPATTAGPPRQIQVHPDATQVREIAATRDGRTLASTADDFKPAAIADLREVVARLAPGMLPAAGPGVALTDRATGRVLARSPGSSHPTFAPDGRSVILCEPDGSFSIRAVPHR